MTNSTEESMQVPGDPEIGRAVPPDKALRDAMREAADDFAADRKLTAPLSVRQLRDSADELLARTAQSAEYRDFLAILVHNAAWRSTVASIPFDRRLLLLPQCLRDSQQCEGHIDDLGLICSRCGRCPIAELQDMAEELGYAVLVAEGSPVVMSLIESGQVQAVVGVSCMSMLEKVFPYMETGAVPGLAIPLLGDGCCDTTVDLEWVREAIRCSGRTESVRQDLRALRDTVDSWFTPEALSEHLGEPAERTQQIACDWLAGSGKRWRPFLAAGVYQALSETQNGDLPEGMIRSAVAVECFHKASLIHDDIEDHDATRYGRPTVHKQYGIEIALNAGDLLIGEGYRLIAEADLPDRARVRMMQVASSGHRTLCLGQGAELCWAKEPRPLTPDEVIEIFAKKTAPEFDVALQIGAICAGAGDGLAEVLHNFSRSLGIAYQIHDDIDDHLQAPDRETEKQCGPNIIDALSGTSDSAPVQAATDLMETYKTAAIECLDSLDNSALKALLRRVVGKIFCDFEIMSCCDDDPSRNADRRTAFRDSAR